MIRKTQSNFKRQVRTWQGRPSGIHTERVLKETWWFLFMPIYTRETIEATTI